MEKRLYHSVEELQIWSVLKNKLRHQVYCRYLSAHKRYEKPLHQFPDIE